MQYCCICFICIVLFFYVGFIIMIFLCSALRRKHNKWKSFSQMWILYMWKPEKVLTDQSRYKASSYNYYGWAKFSVFYSLRWLSIYIWDNVLYWLTFWMKCRIQQWDFDRQMSFFPLCGRETSSLQFIQLLFCILWPFLKVFLLNFPL